MAQLPDDVRDSLVSIKKMIQCTVCLDELTKPEILSCSHVFCSECIAEALKFKLCCPVCHQNNTRSIRPETTSSEMEKVVTLSSSLVKLLDSSLYMGLSRGVNCDWKPVISMKRPSISSSIIIDSASEVEIQMKEQNQEEKAQNHVQDILMVGDTVKVAARIWPGINKEGGAAWIVKVNLSSDLTTPITYDVKYILTSQREKCVPKEFVVKDSSLNGSERPRRASMSTPTSSEKSTEGDGSKRRRISRSPLKSLTNSVNINIRECSNSSSTFQKLEKRMSKLVLLATAIDDENKETLNAFASKFNAILTEDVDENEISHLVVRTNRDGIIKQRTMKYMMALMLGCWIVDISWIQSCLACNELVPEAKFEANHDSKGMRDNVPRIARLAKQNKERLFEKHTILLYGGFPYPGPNKRQLFHLVREGGARAYERLDEVLVQFFGCGVVDTENTERFYDLQHAPTLFLPTICATKESAESFMDDVKEIIRICNGNNSGIVSPLDISEEVKSKSSCKIIVVGERFDGQPASIEFKLVLPIWIFDSISNYEVLDINERLYVPSMSSC